MTGTAFIPKVVCIRTPDLAQEQIESQVLKLLRRIDYIRAEHGLMSGMECLEYWTERGKLMPVEGRPGVYTLTREMGTSPERK